MSTQQHYESNPHDWASPDYVRFWAERSDREEEERRYRFDLMADLIPHTQDAPIAILDIGTGYGALTGVLLEHFHAARATCLDGSAAMLELLGLRQARFRDRLATVLANYGNPDWTAHLAGAHFDVVVSSQGMHGQRERRKDLYREIHGVLKPGGCFLNVDLLPVPTAGLAERLQDVQVRRRMRRLEHEMGTRPRYEDVLAGMEARRAHDAQAPHARAWNVGDWTQDLTWLREAGFVDVDCFWKELRMCLLGGYSSSTGCSVEAAVTK